MQSPQRPCSRGRRRGSARIVTGALMLLVAFATSQPAYAASGAFDPLFSLCLASNPPTTPETLWRSWSLAPQVVLPLLAALMLYGRGLWVLRRTGTAPPSWQVACAAAGWLVLVVALVSPLCRLAATLVSAHMVQHMLLVAVAPPLLVLARPLPMMNAALPQNWQSAIAPFCTTFCAGLARGWRRHGGSLAAGAAYGAAIWLWHVPVIYQAVLLYPALHLLAYVGLIGVSLLYWATVVTAGRDSSNGYGAAVLSMLTTAMHTGLLGALLTFVRDPWYPVLAGGAGLWGLSPLTDQQLAGLVMWIPMGAVYLVGSLIAATTWLAAAARPTTAGD
jgi:putative membrane protein